MADEARHWWEKHARQFQEESKMPIDVLYGTQVTEDKLQLIGPVQGKRLLEIGCGGAQCGIAFAKQGAIVTGVDIAAAQIEFATDLAREHGVSIEFHHRDMTDLSPIQSESQDIVFSAIAVQYVDDISACFREAFRVLKVGGVFVWSVGHPFAFIQEGGQVTSSYFDTGKIVCGADVSDEIGFAFAENHRTVSDYFNALVAAGFVVERMVEPDIRPLDHSDPHLWLWGNTPTLLERIPATLIIKSRKTA